jgi:soluble cytochrome b562
MAAPDPKLSNLLKWSIEASTTNPSSSDQTSSDPRSSQPPRASSLNPEALAALFGGPTDADMMKESMTALHSPSVSLPNKLVAFDNFEQLIESIDNANNLEPLGLWTPLLGLLASEEPELARMAAWCVGTAVQNNPAAQELALGKGAVGELVRVLKESKTNAQEEEGREQRHALKRKAVYALSSEVRNFQPGMDALLQALGGEDAKAKVDAADMDAVDTLMERLRA